MSSKADTWKIKIGDFGLTKNIENSTNARTRVGTLLYQAPEILGWIDEDLDDYTEVVDIWSLGCLAYALLAHGPMSEKEVKQYSKRMRRLPTESLRKNKISNQAVSFIEALLVPEPMDRLSAHMALQHPWVKRANPWGHKDLSVFSSTEDYKALQQLYVTGFGSGIKSLSGPEAFYWSIANEHDFITDFLIRNGVEVNGVDSLDTRRTALHFAAKDGDWTAIDRLLRQGADITAEDCQGHRAIHVAAQHGHDNAVTFLTRTIEVDPNVRARYSRKTALHLAASAGHTTMASKLLLDGANVDAQCSNKTTPLHCASLAGNVLLAEELIEKGARIDPQDSMGMSPLRYAVNHDQRSIVGVLLDYGADIHLQDEEGVSPLTRAKELGDRRIKKILVARKASLAIKAKDKASERRQQACVLEDSTVQNRPSWLLSFKAKMFGLKAHISGAKNHSDFEKALLKRLKEEQHEEPAGTLGESRAQDADPTIYYLSNAASEVKASPQKPIRRLRGQPDLRNDIIPRKKKLRPHEKARQSSARALNSLLPDPDLQEIRPDMNEYRFGVGNIWNLLSPAPTIRSDVLEKGRGLVNNVLRPMETEGTVFSEMLGELADNLDACALRVLMERQRRRENLEAKRAEKKLPWHDSVKKGTT